MLYIPCSNGSGQNPMAVSKHRSRNMSMHEWSMTAPVVKVPKLRSRRCQRCRWRKIKCDENWPTCTPCVKARCPCSGPPASMDSDSDSGSVIPSRAGSPLMSNISINGDVDIRYMEGQDTSQLLSHYEYPGGSSYTRVRLASAPRSYPTTTADRVASRLASYLEQGSRFDASLAGDYFKLLPARLGSSAALRDAVALFCMGWGNFRRASPPKTIVDPRAYGKALRSLQRALSGDDNEGKQLACETLAAASVMDRVETLFGGQQGPQCVTHARGIYSLMLTRGPPNLEDELDVCLGFGNQATIMNYLLVHGGENFYLRPEWKDALYQATLNGTETCRSLTDYYFLSLQLGGWPELISQTEQATRDSTDPMGRGDASQFLQRLENDRRMTEGLREEVMAEARRAGQLADRPDLDCPTGFELAFVDYEPMQRLLTYTSVSILLNRLVAKVARALYGSVPADITAEHRRLGELVWRCLPQMRRLGPVSALLFLTPLSLSLEAAAGDQRRARDVVETTMRLGAAAGKLPQEVGALEKVMLEGARLWTASAVPPQLCAVEDSKSGM